MNNHKLKRRVKRDTYWPWTRDFYMATRYICKYQGGNTITFSQKKCFVSVTKVLYWSSSIYQPRLLCMPVYSTHSSRNSIIVFCFIIIQLIIEVNDSVYWLILQHYNWIQWLYIRIVNRLIKCNGLENKKVKCLSLRLKVNSSLLLRFKKFRKLN